MFSRKALVLVFISVSSFSAARHCRKVDIDKSSGFCTVPDPALTPGEMDPSLACVSNNDRTRAVSDSEKNQILAAYGWSSNSKKSSGEFDHWLPHWMGGSDGIKIFGSNLMPGSLAPMRKIKSSSCFTGKCASTNQ